MNLQETSINVEQFKKLLSDPVRKRKLSVKLNQLSLWLGRLVIAFNNLEHTLAREVALELIEVMGVIDRVDYSPKRPLVWLSPTERRVDRKSTRLNSSHLG